MIRRLTIQVLAATVWVGHAPAKPAQPYTAMVVVPAGEYRPLFPDKDGPKTVKAPAFKLERTPVTNRQFWAFTRQQPQWAPGRPPRLFAEGKYLADWRDGRPPENALDAPVVRVSYFAARAYCEWRGARLPTIAEWERAGAASRTQQYGRDEPAYNQTILDWYGRPAPVPLPPVGSQPPNVFGLYDLHGLVWEWVDDFNSALVTGESRGDSSLERSLFCGAGAIGAADPSDYAAFMRFAFRSGLKATFVVKNLGFRCAQSSPPPQEPPK